MIGSGRFQLLQRLGVLPPFVHAAEVDSGMPHPQEDGMSLLE